MGADVANEGRVDIRVVGGLRTCGTNVDGQSE